MGRYVTIRNADLHIGFIILALCRILSLNNSSHAVLRQDY
jgi:hypothetical protein